MEKLHMELYPREPLVISAWAAVTWFKQLLHPGLAELAGTVSVPTYVDAQSKAQVGSVKIPRLTEQLRLGYDSAGRVLAWHT